MIDPRVLFSRFKELTKTMRHFTIKFFWAERKTDSSCHCEASALKHQLWRLRGGLFDEAGAQSQDGGINLVDAYKAQSWEVSATLTLHSWPSEDWWCQRKPEDDLLHWTGVFCVPANKGRRVSVLTGWAWDSAHLRSNGSRDEQLYRDTPSPPISSAAHILGAFQARTANSFQESKTHFHQS